MQATIECQTAEIRDLKARLESCDEAIAERNCLRELCNGFGQWKEQIEYWHKRNLSELMCAYKTQLDKYNGALTAQHKCEVRLKELQDRNDRSEGQLQTLKSNEAQLKTLLAASENNRKNVQAALCKIEVSSCDTHNVVFDSPVWFAHRHIYIYIYNNKNIFIKSQTKQVNTCTYLTIDFRL